LDDLGIARDAPEMLAMTTMTRDHIRKSFWRIRDYARYSKRAPEIVRAIRARVDSRQIWQEVYQRLGRVAQLVSASKNEEAYKTYKDLTFGLERQFV